MIDWNNAESLTPLTKVVPYLFISVGFVVSLAGLFVKTKIDSRILELQENAEKERRNTPPLMDVRLGNSSREQVLLEVVARNEIPFKARWLVVTKRNQVVSGILLEEPEIRPAEAKMRFLFDTSINADKVVDDYVELRFSFVSLYAAELNNPPHLKGEVVKRYLYAGGSIVSTVPD